jgi:outer membrane protein TolC
MMKKNIDVSNFSLSEGRSVLYPKINLHTNYIFNRTQNQAGFALFNQNLGLNIGFSASWNIFNGFKNTNNNKNLQLDVLNATQNFEKTKSLIHLNLSKAFKKLQDDLSILTLEEENLVFAKEYLDITLEQFKLGANTSIEIKMAQQAYQETVNRLVSARYNAKLSETEILKLSGSIIK